MKWWAIALSALFFIGSPDPARAAEDYCQLSAQYPCRGAWCSGNSLRYLKECKKQLEADNKLLTDWIYYLKVQAPISNIDGISVQILREALYDAKYMSAQDFNRAILSDTLDPLTVNAIIRFQSEILAGQTTYKADGWLRSDQFVDLVCRGSRNGADSMRTLGWMFATTQGVEQDFSRSWYLLHDAETSYSARGEVRRQADAARMQGKLDDLPGSVLQDRFPRSWRPGTDYCPLLKDLRAEAHKQIDAFGRLEPVPEGGGQPHLHSLRLSGLRFEGLAVPKAVMPPLN